MSGKYVKVELRELNIAQGFHSFSIMHSCGGFAEDMSVEFVSPNAVRIMFSCGACSCWDERRFELDYEPND
jgi:hypothetical protein